MSKAKSKNTKILIYIMILLLGLPPLGLQIYQGHWLYALFLIVCIVVLMVLSGRTFKNK
ncbi:hypothetical protein [Paenibacillus sp. KS-LC4]|uniref:hypothetical protein n=1 Tax=Paenibacillus sp. KS-LC4 TaxID=2979727 RepID=UPI0030CEAF55